MGVGQMGVGKARVYQTGVGQVVSNRDYQLLSRVPWAMML